MLFAGNVRARLPRYVVVGEILSVSRHSPCPCHGSQVGSLAPMLGTWGCQLPQGPGGLPPPSPRAPGPCPLHTIGISSLGPDGPEYLILSELLIQVSAGLRWGPGESVLTHPHGRCRLSAGRQLCGFCGLSPALPTEQQRPVYGRLGAAGVCRRDASRQPSLGKPGFSTKATVRCSALPVTHVAQGDRMSRDSLPGRGHALPASSAHGWPQRAVHTAPGSPTRHTSASLCPHAPGEAVRGPPLAPEQASPRACGPQRPRLHARAFLREPYFEGGSIVWILEIQKGVSVVNSQLSKVPRSLGETVSPRLPGHALSGQFVSPQRARVGPRGPAAGMGTAAGTAAGRGTGPASATSATRGPCAPTAQTATLARGGTRPTASAQVPRPLSSSPVLGPCRHSPFLGLPAHAGACGSYPPPRSQEALVNPAKGHSSASGPWTVLLPAPEQAQEGRVSPLSPCPLKKDRAGGRCIPSTLVLVLGDLAPAVSRQRSALALPLPAETAEPWHKRQLAHPRPQGMTARPPVP